MNNYEQATQEVRDAFNALCKGRVEAAVKAEREACIDLIHELPFSPAMFATMDEWRGYKNGVGAYLDAIRERSANAGARGQA